jgi:hypothetical protein
MVERMAEKEKVFCEDCRHNVRKYCDGFIFRNWSGRFEGDPSTLPKIPDESKYWTYHECKKNTKGLQFLNLTGDCKGFEKVK